MDSTTQTPPAARTNASRRRRYNPNPIRRRVRHYDDGNTAAFAFITKSFTRHEFGEHVIHIDTAHLSAHCTCEDALFRRKQQNINQPETCCKHALRAVAILEREGALQPLHLRLQSETANKPHFSLHPRGAGWLLTFCNPANESTVEIETYANFQQATYHCKRLEAMGAVALDNELCHLDLCPNTRARILAALDLALPDFDDAATKAAILAAVNDF